MFWLADWFWGALLIVLTVLAHSFALFGMRHRVMAALARHYDPYAFKVRFAGLLGATVLLVTALHAAEAGVWAAVYVMLGALPDGKSAVLYSLGALTTYGHVGIDLEPRWQLMGAEEALDGLMLFGLTTAFLLSVIQGAIQIGEKSPGGG